MQRRENETRTSEVVSMDFGQIQGLTSAINGPRLRKGIPAGSWARGRSATANTVTCAECTSFISMEMTTVSCK